MAANRADFSAFSPVTRIVVPVPGSGVEPVYTFRETDLVPLGIVVSVFGQLFTGVTSGDRKVILKVEDKAGHTIIRSPAFNVIGNGNLQGNNQDVSYTFSPVHGGPAGDADDGVLVSGMPEIILMGGETITLETAGLEPVDIWGQVLIAVV